MTSDEIITGSVEQFSELLKRQDELSTRMASIESKLDEFIRLQNIRVIADRAKVHVEPGLVSKSLYTMKFIDTIYELEIAGNSETIERAMQTVDNSFSAGEREGPSDPNPLLSGHYKTMLKRYLFAGSVFCKGKRVFDCCCGRGWGTNLLSSYAKHVYAIDYDEQLIEECQKYWPSKNITWKYDSVLNPDLFEAQKFDVVTGMEIIEHFTKEDGITLYDNIQRFLKPGGVFVGTTYFPDTRHQADNHPTLQRPDHLFLWTKGELRDELGKYFTDIEIIDSWMVIARKK